MNVVVLNDTVNRSVPDGCEHDSEVRCIVDLVVRYSYADTVVNTYTCCPCVMDLTVVVDNVVVYESVRGGEEFKVTAADYDTACCKVRKV